MASQLQLGAHTGAGTSTSTSRRSGNRQRSAAAEAAKQLLSRLVRSTWRQRSAAAARPRRRAAVRSFGYDLHSYSQNFDDGLASSSGHPLSSVIPCN
jgi:hypothetical protein